VILAKPQTYMNLSGISVRELLEKYELEPADLLVLFDERDSAVGHDSHRGTRSPGTHNGAKSVTSAVGTPEFARLRLGCGPDHPVSDLTAYVFAADEKRPIWKWPRRCGGGGRCGGAAADARHRGGHEQVQSAGAAGGREVTDLAIG